MFGASSGTGMVAKGGIDCNRSEMESQMFTKTIFAAAALATAIAAQPVTTANASPQIDFSISINTPNGSISIGNGGGFYPQPDPDYMSCLDARQYLKGEFKKVQKVECNGSVYTFHVKKFNFGPWKTVKLNRDNGHYWFV
jgi:hypothetical protein